jgi:hypothetical protein
MTLNTRTALDEKFQHISVADLCHLYYGTTEDDTPRFPYTVSATLGFDQEPKFPSQRFTAPADRADELNALIRKYGDILYRHEQSGGSWRDFETVADLVTH